MSRPRALGAFAAAALALAPGRAAGQVTQIKGGSGGSSNSVYLATLGITVNSPDETRWTSSVQDIGGRNADLLVGSRDGGNITMTLLQGDGSQNCATLLGNAASRDGARYVTNQVYIPTTAGSQAVETATGVGLFCMTTGSGRPLLFSASPNELTPIQKLSLRMMAFTIGQSLNVPSASSSGGSSSGQSLASRAAGLGMTQTLRLGELSLDVPVMPQNNPWMSSVVTANNGNRMDQVTATGYSGSQISVTMTRVTDAGSNCDRALTNFVGSDTRVVDNPPYLASRWHHQVVANSRGSFICLAMRNSMLLGSVTTLHTTQDNTRVSVLLIGIRLAAYDRWGEP